MTAGLLTVPAPRSCPLAPPGEYTELRESGAPARVALPGGGTAWLVTDYATARELFADPRLSVDRAHPGYPDLTGAPPPPPEALEAVRTFVDMDPPRHTAERRMVMPGFSVRQARGLAAGIGRDTAGVLEEMLAQRPPVDLVECFASRIPASVFCRLLGVPGEDRAFFRACLVQPRGQGLSALMGYVRDTLVPARSGGGRDGDDPGGNGDSGGGDLVADLVRRHAAAGSGGPEHTAHTLMLLLVAGYETTVNTLALGALLFLLHPQQAAPARSGPAAMEGAVEEVLRCTATADTLLRVATADIPLGGVTIRAGEGVVVSAAAANRDKRAFPDPDLFDVRRPGRRHLAFGYGVHQCLGQNLARETLRVALSALLERIPGLRLAVPAERLTAKDAVGLQGVTELPVTWG